ncbi:beta-ketoacyl synthase N-terminal-like domain-containing protein [Bacillus velezensis]|nr:beta-ketoacyl synthase N-terminal-like domain-containing protein [Bacillus velezensis]
MYWKNGGTLRPKTSFSSAANRVSYFLNLKGPSMPVDTMCSSSLTAIHEACENILRGECDMAIAGGVNVYTHPSAYAELSAYRMLSKDGTCKVSVKAGTDLFPGRRRGRAVKAAVKSDS